MPLWLVPVAGFLKKHWQIAVVVIAVVGGFVLFQHWIDNKVEAAEKKGFANAQAQFQAKVDAANKIAASDTQTMQLIGSTLGSLTAQRSQAIDLKVTPQIERIQNEVASDPRYRDCRVSDSVLDAANAARSAVDAGIAASNPKPD